MNKIFFIFLIAIFVFIIPSSVLSVWTFDADPPSNTIDIRCAGAVMTPPYQCGENLDVTFTCTDTGGSNCYWTKWGEDNSPGSCSAGTTHSYTIPYSYQISIPPPALGGLSAICAKSMDNAGNTTSSTAPYTVVFLGPWFKLKDTSFNNLSSSIRNNILPAPPTPFDTEDDALPYLISASGPNNAGIVLNSTNIVLGTYASNYSKSNNWRDGGTSFTANFSPANYRDYVKSNKDYITITVMSGLTTNKINYFNGSPSGPLTTADFNGKNLVLLVDGNVIISNNFTPTDSVAIISTGTITINSSVTLIKAILIGNIVSFPASANELKIKGNLISSSAITTTNRDRTNAEQPSLFVVFDAEQYLDLLPLLSISTYDRSEIN